MGFLRQTGTLTRKTLLIVAWRQFLATALRAIILPIAFAIFLGYVRTFLAPASTFGIGTPSPVRNVTDIFTSGAVGSRRRVVFIDNGHRGGNIERVINAVAAPLRAAGADVRVTSNSTDLYALCRSSLRGTSGCYGAASFLASPGEGRGNQWSYQLTSDYALGYQVWVDRTNNDAQIIGLPLARAIDSQIAILQGNPLPSTTYQYPYTYRSRQRRDDDIQRTFMRAVGSWLGVTFFLAMCGISYHLPGFIATERESGMSQLIDSMMPGKHHINSQLTRFISTHVAFDLIYIPSWISIGAIASSLVFLKTSNAIVIFFHLLTGISLACYSALGASFFRRAQLSGITVLISALVLAIVAQLAPIRSRQAVIALSILFPSANYTFFLQYMARWERRLMPARLGADYRDLYTIPGYYYFIFVAVQILYYPILAILIERWRFGSSSKGRRLSIMPGTEQAAIKIAGFSKHYLAGFWQKILPVGMVTNRKAVVKAVNDLNLTVRRGETMVLLGANGSGKSTTLDTIAGLTSATKGTIEIDGSGGIGLCPQKNVMWPELTVAEHVSIFDQLKANPIPGGPSAVHALIQGCDLEAKSNRKSKTLSGGQKRKLQLAMAFAGDSQVCCIDEVSSGLDPLSRRKIWEILMKERGKRTILFTTHALDEADALADHVAIMSKGHLKIHGSVVELKERYGGGYRVHVPGQVDPRVAQDIRAASTSTGTETVYQVAVSQDAARLVELIERHGISNYQVNGPTMEDVFLQLAEEGRDELSLAPTELSRNLPKLDNTSAISLVDHASTEGEAIKLHKGQDITVFRQSWILFRKRFRILSRNYMPYICALAIPLATAGLVTYFLADFDPLLCQFADNSSNQGAFSISGLYSRTPIGPSSQIRLQQFPVAIQQNRAYLVSLATYNAFQSYIRASYNLTTVGGFYLDSPFDGAPVLAYRIDNSVAYAVGAQNLLNSYLSGTPINVRVSTFALPIASSTGNSLQLTIYLGLAMLTYPAFFALYPTFERLRNIRTLHYSNGIRAAPLWLAYIMFDLIMITMVSVITIVILTQISSVWYGPGYLWVVFFLFGISSALFSYVISLFATSQLAAFAFAAGVQAVFLLAYFIAFLGLVSFSLPDKLLTNLNIVQFTLGLLTPSGNLLRALFLTLNQSQIVCRDQTYTSYAGGIEIYGGPILYLVLQIIGLFTFLVAYDNGWRPRWNLLRKQKNNTDQEKTFGLAEKEVQDETLRTERSEDALQVLHLNKSFGSDIAVDDVTFGVKHGEVFALLGPNGAGKSTTISLIRGDIRPSTMHSSDILVEGVSVNQHRTTTRRNLGVCPQFDAIDRMTVTEHLRFYAQASGVRDVHNNVDRVIEAVGLQDFRTRMADQLSGGNKRKLSLGISIIGNPSVLLLDEPSSGMDAISKRIMWKLLDSVKTGRSLVLTTHSMEEVSALADRAGIMAKRMLAVGTTQLLRTNHATGYHVHIVHKNAPEVSEFDKQRITEWIRVSIPGAMRSHGNGDMLHGQLKFHVPKDDNGPYTSPPQTSESSGSLSANANTNTNITGTDGTSIMRTLRLLERNKEDLGIAFYSVSPTTLEDVFLDIVGKHGVVEHDEKRSSAFATGSGKWRFLPRKGMKLCQMGKNYMLN